MTPVICKTCGTVREVQNNNAARARRESCAGCRGRTPHADRIMVACKTCGVEREVNWKYRLRAAKQQCRVCTGTQPHPSPEALREAKRAATERWNAKRQEANPRVPKVAKEPRKPRKMPNDTRDHGGHSAPALKATAHKDKALPERYVPAPELCEVESDNGYCQRRLPCRVHGEAA